MKETQENQQNAEAQRERYYATIHKVALQQAANTAGGPDKIPGDHLLQLHISRGIQFLSCLYQSGELFFP